MVEGACTRALRRPSRLTAAFARRLIAPASFIALAIGLLPGLPAEAAAKPPAHPTEARPRAAAPRVAAVRARPAPRVAAVRAKPAPRHAQRPRTTVRPAAAPPARRVIPASAPPPQPPVPDFAAATVSRDIFAAIEAASGEQDTKRALLFTLAWRESRGDPRADNPVSSARGLLQFTRVTWLEVVRDHGAAVGLRDYAADIETNRATGEIAVRSPQRLAAILALRDDPHLSAALAMLRLEREEARIAAALGRPVTDGDLYLAHFLGAGGTLRFLRALAQRPSAPAAGVVGRHALAANRNIFIDRRGHRRTVQDVYATIREDLRAQGPVYAALRARVLDTSGQMELAAAQ